MKQNDLKIATPCPMTWNEFEGDSPTCRFCSGCKKNVHNLSHLTEKDAQSLVDKREGELCVVYEYSTSGKVKHRSTSRLKRFFSLLLLLVPISSLITACGGAVWTQSAGGMKPNPILEDPLIRVEHEINIAKGFISGSAMTAERASKEQQ